VFRKSKNILLEREPRPFLVRVYTGRNLALSIARYILKSMCLVLKVNDFGWTIMADFHHKRHIYTDFPHGHSLAPAAQFHRPSPLPLIFSIGCLSSDFPLSQLRYWKFDSILKTPRCRYLCNIKSIKIGHPESPLQFICSRELMVRGDTFDRSMPVHPLTRITVLSRIDRA